MARKVNKITINQYQGEIKVYRNDELETQYNLAGYMKRIQEGKITASGFANFIAEIMHDCLNCKTASCKLTDLDGLGQYSGTYFEYIDNME